MQRLTLFSGITLLLALATLVLLSGCNGSSPSTGGMVDLDLKTGAAWQRVNAINNAGQIVGAGELNTPGTAMLWTPGAGVTTLEPPTGYLYSEALDINEVGQVVVSAWGNEGVPRGFLWTPATSSVTDLGTLPNDSGVYPYAVNDQGVVVGVVSVAGVFHGFRWTAQGGMEDLGTDIYPMAINNAGHIAGTSHEQAARWIAGTIVTLPAPTGQVNSGGAAINTAGQIVGYSNAGDPDTASTPLCWQADNSMTALPIPFTMGLGVAINTSGTVAGAIRDADGNMHATLWLPGGGTRDLGFLPGTNNSEASAINDLGQVVGHCRARVVKENSTATRMVAVRHAFLWTPE